MRFKPVYPFLFVIFPILALFSHNVDQIRFYTTYRSFAGVLLVTTILLLILRIILQDWHRAAIISLVAIVLFFSYGHVYLLTKSIHVFGVRIGRHRYLIALWGLLFLFSFWLTIKKLKNPEALTPTLNLLAIVILIIPIGTITQFEIQLNRSLREGEQFRSEDCRALSRKVEPSPDVYYIILDAYAGHDVLWEAYGLNNTTFLDTLSQIGFYVADRSQSNYNHTELSLTSSLNMSYLDALDPVFSQGGPSDDSPLWGPIKHGIVRKNFECLGYSIVTFDSGYYWTGWRDSDIFVGIETEQIGGTRRLVGINSFESLLIETSAGVILTSIADRLPTEIELGLNQPFQEHRDRTLSILNSLNDNIPLLPGPKFIFAHLLIPHSPYVFGPNGEPIEQTGAFTLGNAQGESGSVPELVGYPNQVNFINTRILETVKSLISSSRVPPIIIIQGDHGIGRHSRDKISILNAYYFPGVSGEIFYAEVSPVNTFRMLFNQYFGGQYVLLEDIAYYSPMDEEEKYMFSVIPNERIPLSEYEFVQP